MGVLKPNTFMNESGRSVRKAVDYYKLALGAADTTVLVVVDEVALPFGALRLRGKGSPGGHNGLKSIEKSLGSPVYGRLRFGVGAPRGDKVDGGLVSHVLGTFSYAERDGLDDAVAKAAEAVELWCREDSEQRAMSAINGM